MDEEALKEQIGFKIRQFRNLKRWSRQQAASKLEMSLNGYSNIERGEVDISLTRLCQIAETFGIELSYLLGAQEKNVFHFNKTQNTECLIGGGSLTNLNEMKDIQLKHELEKSRILLQEREKEINYLKEENARLKEMLEWLKVK
jgi:transcriptional regulator with XRE-family HTH domain